MPNSDGTFKVIQEPPKKSSLTLILAIVLGVAIGIAISNQWLNKTPPKSIEVPLVETQGEPFTDDEEHELTVINGYRVSKQGRFVFAYEVFYRDGSEIKYRYLGENVKVRIDAEDGQYNYMVKDTIHIHNFNEIQRRK